MDNQDYVVPSEQQEKLEEILTDLQVGVGLTGWRLTTEEIQAVAEFLSTRVKVLSYLERTVEPLQVNPAQSHLNAAVEWIRDGGVDPFDRPARRKAPDHDSMGPMK